MSNCFVWVFLFFFLFFFGGGRGEGRLSYNRLIYILMGLYKVLVDGTAGAVRFETKKINKIKMSNNFFQ